MLLCSKILINLSQMSFALEYVITKSAIEVLNVFAIRAAVLALSHRHSDTFFRWSFVMALVFTTTRQSLDPSMINVESHCSKCIFICHFYLFQFSAHSSLSICTFRSAILLLGLTHTGVHSFSADIISTD